MYRLVFFVVITTVVINCAEQTKDLSVRTTLSSCEEAFFATFVPCDETYNSVSNTACPFACRYAKASVA
jgi:hypothetical protein